MKAIVKISVLSTALLFSSPAFYSIPPGCEAAVTPVRIVQLAGFSMPQNCEASIAYGAYASAVILFQPPVCEASVMEQLCSSVTSFLDDEADKAGAALKSCKTNCRWKKRKDDLITAAKKKAKDSCSKGQAPDINEINRGLDTDTKTRLKNLYNQNSRMFDGTAKLPNRDFEPISSKQTATLTGKGGLVTDLKSAEPNVPKLSQASEFGLTGTKLSGETAGSATTKQSPLLLAAAASAKTSAGTASASQPKSPTAGTASDKAAVLAAEPQTCDECKQMEPNLSRRCLGICCAEAVKKYPKDAAKQSNCYTLCTGITAGAAAQCKCCQDYNSLCTTFVSGCTPGGGTGKPGFLTRIKNWWHGLWGEKPCGGGYYKTKTQCCANRTTIFTKCGGECYDFGTQYCENGKIEDKCEGSCSAGNIAASPAPVNNEVILPIGGTATLSISGETPPGGQFQWSTSGGTLTPLSDRQTTITSGNSGKFTVTVTYKTTGKPCSKCSKTITVSFVKVVSIVPKPDTIWEGETIKFTVTTEPAGAAYMRLVKVTVTQHGANQPPPADSVVKTYQSLEEGVTIIQFNKPASFEMLATAGGSDKGQRTGLLQVYERLE